MTQEKLSKQTSFDISIVVFGLAALLFNILVVFQITTFPLLLYIGQAFVFAYILITPGLFLLPFLTRKRLPFGLGVSLSVALSVFSLMIIGLCVNTILPLFGIAAPLTTIPLLIAFDIFIFILFLLNDRYETAFAFHLPHFNSTSWIVIFVAALLPIIACLGAIVLNNGGSNILSLIDVALISSVVLAVVIFEKNLDESVSPVVLFLVALTLLLMNSMRGWFVTGHDILLEYHVFTLTNNAHLWNIAIFRDPYNSCLSLTILPTYLQNLMHVSNAYVFKLLTQFLGALPVVILYYISRRYVSNSLSFLAGFIYIAFPTFIVDMAFLNRQGIAFLFLGAMLIVLFSTDYFSGRARTIALFLFGTGIILSHYSSSYIAITLLICTYIINKALRFIMTRDTPLGLSKLTSRFGNKEMYREPSLLSAGVVLGLFVILILWSAVITKTSTDVVKTLEQIATTIEHPFNDEDYTGGAKYTLFQSKQVTPQELFNQFSTQAIKKAQNAPTESNLYPLSLANQYPAFPVAPINEPPIPLTLTGQKLQSVLHMNLSNLYNELKGGYAALIELLLIIGVIALGFGYGFKGNIIKKIPVEFIALSLSGILVIAGQTILPPSVINYGIYRLFQQNLIFLSLPIALVLLACISLVVRNRRAQLLIQTGILLFFFLVLSGFIPQLTGGGRAPLALDNYGFYYDAYYTHAQEVSGIDWLATQNTIKSPIQSDHYFSSVKILAYANEGAITGLLSQTIQKDSYVYLNYNNVKNGTVVEFIGPNVFYYHLSTAFLQKEKNLIYNDGGSEIYR